MSVFHKICLGFFLLLIFIISALAFLIINTNGVHILLKNTVLLVPGLKICSIDGDRNNLMIKQLQYCVPGLTINVNKLYLKMKVESLYKLQLCLNNLCLDNVSIDINTSKFRQKKLSINQDLWHDRISNHFLINLQKLVLNNTHIKINNTNFILNNINTGFKSKGNNLILLPTKVIGLLIRLPTTIKTKINKHNKVQIIEFDKYFLNKKEIDKGKFIKLVLKEIALIKTLHVLFDKLYLWLPASYNLSSNLIIKDTQIKDFHLIGNNNLIISRLHLKANIHNQKTKLLLLDIYSPQITLHAFGDIMLSGRWPISMIINTIINNKLIKKENINIKIDGYLLYKLNAIFNFSGPIITKLEIKSYLSKIDLSLIPIINKQLIQQSINKNLSHYKFTFFSQKENKEDSYQLILQAALTSNKSLPVNLSCNIKFNIKNNFTLLHLKLALLQGLIDCNIIIDYRNNISWRSELSFCGINTIYQLPNWYHIKLDGKVIIEGIAYDDSWQLFISKLDFHGYIKHNPLQIKGSFNFNSIGQYNISQISLMFGRNKLIIEGTLKDDFALNFLFNVQELDLILNKLNGRINGYIKIHGNPHIPHLLINLNTKALRWRELSIKRMTFLGNIYFSDIINGIINLKLDDILNKSLFISNLELNIRGNEKQHKFKINVYNNSIRAKLQLNGNFNRKLQFWHGTLNHAYLNTLTDTWQIARGITIDHQIIQKDRIIRLCCCKYIKKQIYLPKNNKIRNFEDIKSLLNNFFLKTLKSIIKKQSYANSIVNILTNLYWTSKYCLSYGKTTLTGNKVIASHIVNGKYLPLIFDNIKIGIVFHNKLIKLNWLTKIVNDGQINGCLQVIKFNNQRLLSGDINMHHISLILLKYLMLKNNFIKGLIDSKLRINGDIKHPKIYGHLKLKRFIIKNKHIPFNMTNSYLMVVFTGKDSIFNGIINTTYGQICINGIADWNRMFTWYIHIKSSSN